MLTVSQTLVDFHLLLGQAACGDLREYAEAVAGDLHDSGRRHVAQALVDFVDHIEQRFTDARRQLRTLEGSTSSV